jgi:sec-independent protein translocase protein TatA
MPIGPLELVLLLLIVLVIVGGKRLPALGRQLGTGMREFKDSVTRKADEDPDEPDALERPRRVDQPREGDAPVVDGEVVRDRRS